MDLGFLVIANLVMRTRMPPKRRRTEGGSVFKEVVTDGPYLLFIFGSFLVRVAYVIILTSDLLVFGRFFGEPSYLVRSLCGTRIQLGNQKSVFYLQLYAALHGVSPAFVKYSVSHVPSFFSAF